MNEKGYMEVTHTHTHIRMRTHTHTYPPSPSPSPPWAIFKPKEQRGSVRSFLAADNWNWVQEHPRVTLLALYVSDNNRKAEVYLIMVLTEIKIHLRGYYFFFLQLWEQVHNIKGQFTAKWKCTFSSCEESFFISLDCFVVSLRVWKILAAEVSAFPPA